MFLGLGTIYLVTISKYDLINIDLLILLHLLHELLFIVLLVYFNRGKSKGRCEDEIIMVVGGDDRLVFREVFHLLVYVALKGSEVDYYGAFELGFAVALHVEGRGGY